MGLESVLGVLRRRWLALVLCLAVGVVGAVLHTHTTPRSYRSTARLFVNLPSAQTTQEALQGVQLSSQLIQSYADILTTRTAAAQVRDRLGLSESPGTVLHHITATPVPQTLIIAVSATDRDPLRAQSLAQAAAVVLNDSVRALEHDRTPTSAVEASIVDQANLPSAPSTPRPKRDVALGILLGLLAGLAVALVVDALDRTVKIPAAIEHLIGAPPLAVVPRIKGGKSTVIAADPAGSPAAEAYRALRTSLQFVDVDEPVRSLLITSPTSGDGKSTTAANLAIALAEAGERVILVDADLRKAGLADVLGVEPAVGLTGVLSGRVALDAALQPYRDRLQVLAAGALPPNPSELLGSERMMALIDDLVGRCDVVIFDAPPVLAVTDAVVLSAQVDGTGLVLRHGRSTRADAVESVQRLTRVDADVIGFILNAKPRPQTGPYYASYARASAVEA